MCDFWKAFKDYIQKGLTSFLKTAFLHTFFQHFLVYRRVAQEIT